MRAMKCVIPGRPADSSLTNGHGYDIEGARTQSATGDDPHNRYYPPVPCLIDGVYRIIRWQLTVRERLRVVTLAGVWLPAIYHGIRTPGYDLRMKIQRPSPNKTEPTSILYPFPTQFTACKLTTKQRLTMAWRGELWHKVYEGDASATKVLAEYPVKPRATGKPNTCSVCGQGLLKLYRWKTTEAAQKYSHVPTSLEEILFGARQAEAYLYCPECHEEVK